MTYFRLFLIYMNDQSYKEPILQRLFIKSIFFFFFFSFFSLWLSALRDKKTDFQLQASFERTLALILQCDFQNLCSVKGCHRWGRDGGWKESGF